MALRDNLSITFIIVFAILLSVLFLDFHDIWWDSAVFIEMGKFAYSSGESGFWEPARPIILPLLLGFVWSTGLDVVVFGGILVLLFGAGCVYLTYLISKKIFKKKIALISAMFLAFSVTFLSFNSMILTGIPSIFFGLLTIYYFIKKKYFLVGLFSGIAFMTRFAQLVIFAALFIVIIFDYKKEKNLQKNILQLISGFLLIIIPYLVFNHFMYGSILYPFLLQKFLTTYTGGAWHQSWWFYLSNLLKENFLLLFSIPGIIFIIKKLDYKKSTILFPFLIFFILFTFIDVKVIRYMIVFLPFLYILTSYGIFNVSSSIKNKKLVATFFIFIFLVWFIQTTYSIYLNNDPLKTNKHLTFQNYIEEAEEGIWITNPVFAVHSDKKINEIMYYPTFNNEKFLYLKANINRANNVLINTCDLYCEPYNTFCEDDKAELLSIFTDNFDIVYQSKENECESYIFRR
jgi:4-amino-4-deoxy-L-arabinose transferase-like glycosyltransferase